MAHGDIDLRDWQSRLEGARFLSDNAVGSLNQTVVEARRAGCSWRFIAECLDEPFQTVHSRYSKLVGTR
jgi:hypothetical protein